MKEKHENILENAINDHIMRVAEQGRDNHYTYRTYIPAPVRKALQRNEIPLGWADEEKSTELISVKLRDEEKALLEQEETYEVLRNMRKFEFLGQSLRLMISSSAEGSGKCQTGDTQLIVRDMFGYAHMKTLKELFSEQKPYYVQSLDEDSGELLWNPIKTTYNGKKETLKIMTRSGQRTTATKNHPFLSFDENGYCWKNAEDLKIGDRIGIPRKTNMNGKNKITQEEAIILAYLIADGSLKRNVSFAKTNDKRDEIEEIISLVQKVFQNTRVREEERRGKNHIFYFVKENGKSTEKSDIRKWIIKNGLNVGSKYKFIPREIMESSDELKRKFLNRLFTCDGSIHKINGSRTWGIEYSSVSEKLVRDISTLLFGFGIMHSVRKKTLKGNQYGWRLTIYGNYVIKFLEKIGFYGTKEDISKQALNEMKKIKRNPNNDTVPKDVWKIIERGIIEKGLSTKILADRDHCLSRDRLEDIAQDIDSDKLYQYANDDIFWDEVENIRDAGIKDTYAVEVENNHNYVSDNIITHNTVLLGIIVLDFLHNWYGMPVLYHDPQWEIHFREKPNSNKRDRGILNTISDITGQDFSPIGHNNIDVYTPYFLRSGNIKKDGNVYQYDSNNLTLDDLTTIMGTDLAEDDESRLKQYLLRLYKSQGQNVENIEIDTMKLPPINSIGSFVRSKIQEERGARGVETDRVMRALRNAVAGKRIGNDAPAPGIIESLEKGNVAVVQTTTSEEKWDVTAAYLAPELRNIMAYRQRAINKTLPKAKMNKENALYEKGVLLAFEELQVGYPVSGRKSPTSKSLLKNILAVGRQQGISVGASASTLTSIISDNDEDWLTKTNVFVLGRIISIGEKAIMNRFFGRDRQGRRKTELLTRLVYDKRRLKRGKAPAQFAYITRDKEIEPFYPMTSRSEFRREKSI